jgi:hypothetical protein
MRTSIFVGIFVIMGIIELSSAIFNGYYLENKMNIDVFGGYCKKILHNETNINTAEIMDTNLTIACLDLKNVCSEFIIGIIFSLFNFFFLICCWCFSLLSSSEIEAHYFLVGFLFVNSAEFMICVTKFKSYIDNYTSCYNNNEIIEYWFWISSHGSIIVFSILIIVYIVYILRSNIRGCISNFFSRSNSQSYERL